MTSLGTSVETSFGHWRQYSESAKAARLHSAGKTRRRRDQTKLWEEMYRENLGHVTTAMKHLVAADTNRLGVFVKQRGKRAHTILRHCYVHPFVSEIEFRTRTACVKKRGGPWTLTRGIRKNSSHKRLAEYCCANFEPPRTVPLDHWNVIKAASLTQQQFETRQRMKGGNALEATVIDYCRDALGMTQVAATSGRLPGPGQFIYKARLAINSGSKSTKEVDIAFRSFDGDLVFCECKMVGDFLNSRKRVKEIINTATCWQTHYQGSDRRITTVAVFQGMLEPRCINDLLTNDVRLVWAHRLDELQSI